MMDSSAPAHQAHCIKSATHKVFSKSSLSLTVTSLCSALFITSVSTAATGASPSALYLTTILDSQQRETIDGPAPAARTGFLESMASDRKGNLYFSDGASYAIRQLSANGIVRTLTDEVLFNVDFMAVDSNDQLYFLQVFDLLRGKPRWEIKRLHDNGDTELIARGDGNAFGMQHNLNDGFYVHINHSRYDDIDRALISHHEFIRVSNTGYQEVIHDSRSTGSTMGNMAPQRPLTQINGMTVDNDGTLVVLDNLMLRRIYDDGVLEDIASFSPSIASLPRDITFNPSNQIVLCTENQVSIWDLSTYQLVYMIGDAPYGLPDDSQSNAFASVRGCHSDSLGNIHVMQMNGLDHHTISRIHASPEPLMFPALHNWTDFAEMLQSYTGGQFSIGRSGIIEVSIDGYDYQLIADETVVDQTSDLPAGIHEVDDKNGDGLNEFLLVFPDRRQQLLYLMAPENLPPR